MLPAIWTHVVTVPFASSALEWGNRQAMKVITAYTHKGGTGKTTTLFMLANAIASQGATALLLDCDSHQSFSALQAYSIRGGVNWWYDGFEIRYMDFQATPVIALERALLEADESGKYEYCLINLQGSDHPFNRYVLRYAELTILPFSPAGLDALLLPQAVEVLNELREENSLGKARVLLNKIKHRMSSSQRGEMDEARADYEVMSTEIREMDTIRDLVYSGILPMTINNPQREISGFDEARIKNFRKVLEISESLLDEVNSIIDGDVGAHAHAG